MVYLSTNDDGATVFKNHEIYPKEGSVLIFNQNMEHRGDVNTKEKYFIRSEIMYNRERSIKDKKELDAFALYENALQLNKDNLQLAKDLEEQAFKSSPLLEAMIYNYL
jgi:hypothetical protein